MNSPARKIVVVGASRGIGAAVAQDFANQARPIRLLQPTHRSTIRAIAGIGILLAVCT